MITMYGIPNCDKIKKAKVWLKKHNAEYKFYNYKTEGCDEHLANKLLSHFSYKDVLNKRGTTWRKLPENKKSTAVSYTHLRSPRDRQKTRMPSSA